MGARAAHSSAGTTRFVGIGASAGGLVALEQLLEQIPREGLDGAYPFSHPDVASGELR